MKRERAAPPRAHSATSGGIHPGASDRGVEADARLPRPMSFTRGVRVDGSNTGPRTEGNPGLAKPSP